jgi:hypothetical protein
MDLDRAAVFTLGLRRSRPCRLITELAEAMNEEQSEIRRLRAEVAELKRQIARLEAELADRLRADLGLPTITVSENQLALFIL